MCNLRSTELNARAKQQTRGHGKQTGGYQRTGGGTNYGFGINRYELLCIKWISNRDMLYSTAKSSHYFVITYNGV